MYRQQLKKKANEQARWIQKGGKVTELYVNGEGWADQRESYRFSSVPLSTIFMSMSYKALGEMRALGSGSTSDSSWVPHRA